MKPPDANDILREHGPDGLRQAWDQAHREKPNGTDPPNGQHRGNGRADRDDGQAAPSITAIPFVLRDPKVIEPRRWLYGRHIIRGFLSATIAPGGVGKSSLELVDVLAMATGRNLIGNQPAGKLRVWYHNTEDPLDEIERRIAAICVHYRITADDIGDRLFVTSGRNTEIIIAGETKTGVQIAEPVAAAVLREIRDKQIDVLTLDPFVGAHAVSENDNARIGAVARAYGKIADAGQCGVELVHHSRKSAPGQGEIGVEDARGASALIAATRSARTLNVMTPEEAKSAGVEKHRAFFRVDSGKANLAPPPEATTWHQIISVSLGNDRDDRPGDSVGVVTAWAWLNPLEDVTVGHLRAVQKRIAEGEWRADSQSTDWAGKAVAEALGLDIADPKARAKVKGLIRIWVANGALREVQRNDSKRRPKMFVEVGQWING